MDRIEKGVMATSIALLLVFFGAIVVAATSYGVDVPTCVTDRKPFVEGQAPLKMSDQPLRYEVHTVARMWMFDPPEITVPRGAEVDLYLSSADVVHGFYVEGTNVNLMAVPGAVTYQRVKFNREGTYRILCHEYCGTAHHLMAGSIVVSSSMQEQQ
ncbi:MAG: cytochrome c oxidase subunit II [Chlorobi bacterium]|nr:cytochrome c oxidase subunit II [Chlorobiota bacterium]